MRFDIGFIVMFMIAIIALIFFVIGYFIRTLNTLVRLENKVKELDSDIDVALTKRYDLLKKQYDAVKMYCSHESRTLMETIKLRSGMSSVEKDEVSVHLDELSKQIRVTMEAYPILKSSDNVMALQRSCDNAEEHLQAARRLYNTGVTNYNNLCAEFPSSIIAMMTGHKSARYFRADDEKRKDIEFL